MRENDGRKLDHKTLEVLRVRAVNQVQAGARPEDVAQAPGLHRTTVCGWLARYRRRAGRAAGEAGAGPPAAAEAAADAQRLTARAANTMVRCASIESRVRW